MTIQLLAHDVAAKIAAGEVVERPANVAKELLENSLDAGATEIRVEIREGGQRLLRVIDNGAGIVENQVALAFERHSTSKLRTAEDLNHIATFGFRGEALYSIAAVSQLTLTTRPRDEAAQSGVQVHLEGGHLRDQRSAGTPPGTTISVEQLFFNMPARRKFLRKAATEAGHISSVIQRFALAYPDRRFSYINEGRLLFQSTGSGDLFDVLVKIYGLENARQMVPVGGQSAPGTAHQDESQPGLDEEVDFMGVSNGSAPSPPSTITVSGYTSLPGLTRANRTYIDLFVNRRYVEDRNLTYAVIQAYHTLLPGGRYPIAAIFIDIDPEQVDVNVHPQKTQVRFHEDRRVFTAVQKAVRSAIIATAPVPDMPLPGSGRRTSGTGTWSGASSERSARSVDGGQQELLDIFVPPSQPAAPVVPPPQPRSTGPEWAEPAPARPGEMPPVESAFEPEQRRAASHPEPTGPGPAKASPPDASQTPAAPASGAMPEQSSEAATTYTDAPQRVLQKQQRKLPPLRVVGQVGTMYIVTEGPEGLFLIDQHAAHERILYEQFMAQRYGTSLAGTDGPTAASERMSRGIAQQQLLEPLTLHAGTGVAGLVAEHLEELQRVGFDVEPFGGDTFLVRAIPAVLSGEDPLRTLEEIASTLGGGRNRMDDELEARLVKMICKRASIKAGQQLSDIEMRELVRQLEECQSPRTCPHGRPTMIQLTANELEKAFGRI